MLALAIFLASMPSTGTVRLHLTDAQNRPIPNHEVWLTSTNSTKSIRPQGIQWGIPQGPDSYHGTTDKTGDVAIKGVPTRKPMMVIVKFGPRFDAFVGKNNPSGGTLDVMKFEGAVYAGKRAHVILARDREITGTITDATGKPLPGVKITLGDTGFGHMGGYPGTTLDEQTTDAGGVYRFTKLPNCAFTLDADAPSKSAVETRRGKGPWELIAIVDQEWSSAYEVLTSQKKIRDFRISQTATLTVNFKGTTAQLKGWTAWIENGAARTTGQQLDYAPSYIRMTRNILAGNIVIRLQQERGDKQVIAKKLILKPGESREIEVSMSDVIGGDRNRDH